MEPEKKIEFSNEPAMTPTPAAWQVLIIFAYWAWFPRLDVRMYETG